MENSTKIILGIVLLGGAYYLYTRKKPETVGAVNKKQGNLTDCKNIQTMPCLIAPCPQFCADNVELPKKGGSPSVGSKGIVFDCEKAKIDNKQLYEQVKNTMDKMNHFSEKQKNDSICSMMRDSFYGYDKVGLR